MGITYDNDFSIKEYRRELEQCRKCKVFPSEFELLVERSKELNHASFSSELWFQSYLFSIQEDLKVKKNYPILNKFFADFFFPQFNFVIEIDGSSHDDSKEYDNRRDALFIRRGLKVIRIKNGNRDQALMAIDFIHSKLKSYSVSRSKNKKGNRILIRPAGYEIKVKAVKNQRSLAKLRKEKRTIKVTDRQALVIAHNQKMKMEKKRFKEQKFNEMMLNALKK